MILDEGGTPAGCGDELPEATREIMAELSKAASEGARAALGFPAACFYCGGPLSTGEDAEPWLAFNGAGLHEGCIEWLYELMQATE